ncbi:MAG: FHA domain-containing protein [Deltaproteobacteria bacterium]|nr:FHA domain-containing protein [Deltaproteobacteria bacterium]
MTDAKRGGGDGETVKMGGREGGPSLAPSYLRATLKIAAGASEGSVFELKRLVSIIGRGDNAAVRLDDEGVSREHAAISYHEAEREFRVTDMHSANGTLLNGSRVSEYALRDGDKLLVGETLLVFNVERLGDG